MNFNELEKIPVKDKPYSHRVIDDRVTGLSIRVNPKGRKTYVYRYRLFEKQPVISLGSVFDIDYEKVIEQVIGYNKMVKQGLDPQQDSALSINPYYEYRGERFKVIAALWLEHQLSERDLDKRTIYNYNRVIGMLNEQIGELPILLIKPVTMLTVFQTIQEEKSINYGRMAKMYAGMIFRFAMTYELCDIDPTASLTGQLKTKRTRNHPAIVEEKDFRKLILDMHRFDNCHKIIWHAINILPYVFVRSYDLVNWRWEDIDFEKKQWIFEPSKKGRANMVDSLIVPLAEPVIKRLNEVKAYTGYDIGFVFPAPRKLALPQWQQTPIPTNTLLTTFYRMGYKGEQCVHGFRACAKTILMQKDEFRYEDLTTELQLGHNIRDSYGQAYNRMKDLDVRTRMMIDWGKYLDNIVEDG